MSEFQTLIVEHTTPVATVLLNRPESLNSINVTMLHELAGVLRALAEDDAVRAVVLGASGKGFCSGADISDLDMPGKTVESLLMDDYWPVFEFIATMQKPVICAVQGVMAGIGASIAMHADLTVAADTSKMVMAFTNIGLVPDGGAHQLLIRGLGYQRAFKLIAEGGSLTATECLDLGLIAQVSTVDAVLADAQALAARLAERAPLALRGVKRVLRSASDQSHAEVFAAEVVPQHTCITSEDFKGAVKAFFAKEKPVFNGR